VSLWFSPATSSILAFVTTVHLALASLRNHRRPDASPVSSLALVSVLLAALPWLFPSPAGLATGLVVHAVWFAVCEKLAPPRHGVASRSSSAPAGAVPPGAGSGKPRPSAPPSAPRPQGFVQTPVLAVFDEGGDIRTFRFTRPDGFEFVAGQFVTIRVRVDGNDVVRCYSISSAPETRGYLEISVKRQGLVSNTLHATLRPGSMASLRAPAGVFTYPSGDDRPLLLLGGGIGITPLLSMLRHGLAVEPSRPIALLYSARSEDALAFRKDLRLLAERHPHARIVMAASADARSSDVYPGRIDEGLIRATMPNFADGVALICGPQPMIDALRALLVSLGMAPEQVRSEIFEAAIAAAGGKAHTHEPLAAGVAHTMTCSRAGRAVPVAHGQTLLDAAEAGGVPIDSLCRAGVCGTCRTRVLDGSVACDSTVLADDDRQQGFVLACVSRVLGDCTVEA
jgi:ferredoxin-NADP reductase